MQSAPPPPGSSFRLINILYLKAKVYRSTICSVLREFEDLQAVWLSGLGDVGVDVIVDIATIRPRFLQIAVEVRGNRRARVRRDLLACAVRIQETTGAIRVCVFHLRNNSCVYIRYVLTPVNSEDSCVSCPYMLKSSLIRSSQYAKRLGLVKCRLLKTCAYKEIFNNF